MYHLLSINSQILAAKYFLFPIKIRLADLHLVFATWLPIRSVSDKHLLSLLHALLTSSAPVSSKLAALSSDIRSSPPAFNYKSDVYNEITCESDKAVSLIQTVNMAPNPSHSLYLVHAEPVDSHESSSYSSSFVFNLEQEVDLCRVNENDQAKSR
jgi:hypothetical protein